MGSLAGGIQTGSGGIAPAEHELPAGGTAETKTANPGSKPTHEGVPDTFAKSSSGATQPAASHQAKLQEPKQPPKNSQAGRHGVPTLPEAILEKLSPSKPVFKPVYNPLDGSRIPGKYMLTYGTGKQYELEVYPANANFDVSDMPFHVKELLDYAVKRLDENALSNIAFVPQHGETPASMIYSDGTGDLKKFQSAPDDKNGTLNKLIRTITGSKADVEQLRVAPARTDPQFLMVKSTEAKGKDEEDARSYAGGTQNVSSAADQVQDESATQAQAQAPKSQAPQQQT